MRDDDLSRLFSITCNMPCCAGTLDRFAAFSSYQQHPWILKLATKLMQGDASVYRLLAKGPFSDSQPPKAIRAAHYTYKYSGRGICSYGSYQGFSNLFVICLISDGSCPEVSHIQRRETANLISRATGAFPALYLVGIRHMQVPRKQRQVNGSSGGAREKTISLRLLSATP